MAKAPPKIDIAKHPDFRLVHDIVEPRIKAEADIHKIADLLD